MKVEKKSIINFIFLLAVASTIVSLFIPGYSFNSEDLETDFEYYWKLENSVLTYNFEIHAAKNDKLIYQRYNFLIFNTETGEKPPEIIAVNDYNPSGSGWFGSTASLFVRLTISLFGLTLFAYFSYKFLKYESNKNKYSLYLALGSILVLALTTIYIYDMYLSMDINQLGYLNHIKILYGFYSMITAIVLYFIAHYMQNSKILNKKLNNS